MYIHNSDCMWPDELQTSDLETLVVIFDKCCGIFIR